MGKARFFIVFIVAALGLGGLVDALGLSPVAVSRPNLRASFPPAPEKTSGEQAAVKQRAELQAAAAAARKKAKDEVAAKKRAEEEVNAKKQAKEQAAAMKKAEQAEEEVNAKKQ